MSSDKRKTVDAVKDDWLDSTVIDFLDKEIAASSSSGSNPESEDLDATLTNLLREVVSASERETQPDTKAEEVDRMLSGILVDARERPSPETAVTEAVPAFEAENTGTEPILRESTEPDAPVPIFLPMQDMGKPQLEPAIPPPLVFTTHQKVRPMMPRVLVGFALLLLVGGIGLVFRVGRAKVAATPADSASMSQPVLPSPESQSLSIPAPVARPAASRTGAGGEPRSPETPATRPAAPAKSSLAQGAASAVPDVSAKLDISSRIAQMAELNLPAKPGTGIESTTLSPGPAPALSRDMTDKPANPPAELPHAAVPEASAGGDAAAAKFLESPAKPESAPPDPSPVVPIRFAPPELISRVLPVYPEAVRRMRLSGTVVLDLQIDADGKVVKAVPVSGLAVLSTAAANAALQWRYKPASSNGKNVPSQSRISVIFK
jgi:protein TonB